ncbi:unnamed protein product [Prunus armeniaca]
MMRVIKDCHSCRIIPFAYASGIFLIYIILEAYRTGKGRIVVRGKTDIPHQTDKSALVEKIAELVENKACLSALESVRRGEAMAYAKLWRHTPNSKAYTPNCRGIAERRRRR